MNLGKMLAILKSKRKTIIIYVNNYVVINKNIKRVVNDLCILNGSSLEGRVEYSRKKLSKKYKVPIVINNDLILLELSSWRKDCVLLVADKIKEYKNVGKYLKIRLDNDYLIYVKISKYKLERLLLDYIKIINELKSENNANFV